MKLKERAGKLKTDLPAIFLALKGKDTPVIAKVFAAITIAYALSPIDLIPDFIPVLGLLDDIILLPAFIALTIRLIPKEIFQKYQMQAIGMWENKKPKRWYYSIPIIIIWCAIVIAIIYLIMK